MRKDLPEKVDPITDFFCSDQRFPYKTKLEAL